MTDTKFNHQKASSPQARYAEGGLRSFFAYRDTGVIAATKGRLRVQLVRAARKSCEAKGRTGLHFHSADVHVVYMLRGWAKFDYEGVDTLVEAGDCVHQRPGIVHDLYDWSDDMEFMEIVAPADFATTEIMPPAVVAAQRRNEMKWTSSCRLPARRTNDGSHAATNVARRRARPSPDAGALGRGVRRR